MKKVVSLSATALTSLLICSRQQERVNAQVSQIQNGFNAEFVLKNFQI